MKRIIAVILVIMACAICIVVVAARKGRTNSNQTSDSINNIIPTTVNDSQITYERHWSINPASQDGEENELLHEDIVALFSDIEIEDIVGREVKGRILKTKNGEIDTINISSNEIFITICPDCDPPSPAENGLIPKRAKPSIIGEHTIYLIEHANGEDELFMEKGRQTIWIWGDNKEYIARPGDAILENGVNYSILK